MTPLGVIVGILMIAGLAGSVLPFVPGAPLIVAGAVIYAIATDFSPVGAGRLALLVVIGLAAWALQHMAGPIAARRAGGGRTAIAGAVLGMLVGITFAPLGLLVGPVAGAIVAEVLVGRRLAESLRVGVGTGIGVLAGMASHVALALTMVALFAWWVWHG
jgi:uncharacterized protein